MKFEVVRRWGNITPKVSRNYAGEVLAIVLPSIVA